MDNRPITKRSLFLAAHASMKHVYIAVAVIAAAVAAVLCVSRREDLWSNLAIIPFFLVISLAAVSGIAMKGLQYISAQEKALKFSFDEEMARRGAAGRYYSDRDWIVTMHNGAFLAFRRDFIVNLRKPSHYSDKRNETNDLELVDMNGRVSLVKSTDGCLIDVKKWFRERLMEEAAEERGEVCR